MVGRFSVTSRGDFSIETKGRAHALSEIHLHLNWHCKDDGPMITPEIEGRLHLFLEEYSRKTRGVHFHLVGGTADHVHLAFQREHHSKGTTNATLEQHGPRTDGEG